MSSKKPLPRVARCNLCDERPFPQAFLGAAIVACRGLDTHYLEVVARTPRAAVLRWNRLMRGGAR
jgi:hypothetical protein